MSSIGRTYELKLRKPSTPRKVVEHELLLRALRVLQILGETEE